MEVGGRRSYSVATPLTHPETEKSPDSRCKIFFSNRCNPTDEKSVTFGPFMEGRWAEFVSGVVNGKDLYCSRTTLYHTSPLYTEGMDSLGR